MRQAIAELIKGAGGTVTVSYPDGVRIATKAIVTPLFNRSDDPDSRVTQLGDISRLRWRYIGPPELELYDCKGVTLTWKKSNFEFVWAKSYEMGGGLTHWEGLLKMQEDVYGQA